MFGNDLTFGKHKLYFRIILLNILYIVFISTVLLEMTQFKSQLMLLRRQVCTGMHTYRQGRFLFRPH